MKCKTKKIGVKVISQDDFETFKITKMFNNGDWNYFLIIHIMDFLEMSGDYGMDKEGNKYRYCAEISAVSREAAKDKWSDFARQYEDLKKFSSFEELLAAKVKYCDTSKSWNEQTIACELCQYGLAATLWQFVSMNKRTVSTEANKMLPQINMLFGFFMDKPINLIGDTGWDFIAGNIGLKLK